LNTIPLPPVSFGFLNSQSQIPVRQAAREPHNITDASTGPRPRGRGMNPPVAQGRTGALMLQRGRARAGAECQCDGGRSAKDICFNGAAPARARNGSRSGQGSRRNGCFNGAAPARARNVQRRNRWPQVAMMASTGPRPRGRGMSCGLGLGVSWAPCFNGAAPARARNDALRRRTC